MQALGIDIGGSGMKAALVDVATGRMLTERKKIATPRPSTPEAVTDVVRELAGSFGWAGVTGATFPAGGIAGTVPTAADVDRRWVGANPGALVGQGHAR